MRYQNLPVRNEMSPSGIESDGGFAERESPNQ